MFVSSFIVTNEKKLCVEDTHTHTYAPLPVGWRRVSYAYLLPPQTGRPRPAPGQQPWRLEEEDAGPSPTNQMSPSGPDPALRTWFTTHTRACTHTQWVRQPESCQLSGGWDLTWPAPAGRSDGTAPQGPWAHSHAPRSKTPSWQLGVSSDPCCTRAESAGESRTLQNLLQNPITTPASPPPPHHRSGVGGAKPCWTTTLMF